MQLLENMSDWTYFMAILKYASFAYNKSVKRMKVGITPKLLRIKNQRNYYVLSYVCLVKDKFVRKKIDR